MKSQIKPIAVSDDTSIAAGRSTENPITSRRAVAMSASKSVRETKTPQTHNQSAPAPDANKDLPSDAAADDQLSHLQAAALEISRKVFTAVPRDNDQLVEAITEFRCSESAFSTQAGSLEVLARLNKWAIGRVLGVVKLRFKHGKFEAWLQTHRDQLGFGKSSAENYMNLAKKYSTALIFLKEDAPLRELYNRQDIDEGDDYSEATTQGKKEQKEGAKLNQASKAEALMKSLTSLQKRLRHLTETDEQLEADQIRQLKLVKAEIDRFFDTIINQKPASK